MLPILSLLAYISLLAVSFIDETAVDEEGLCSVASFYLSKKVKHTRKMGAAASIDPAVFAEVKTEYEAKKAEGVSDEVLFESMKAFIEQKTAETKTASSTTEVAAEAISEAPAATEAAAEVEAPVAVEEAKPADGDAAGTSVEAEPVVAEAVAAE